MENKGSPSKVQSSLSEERSSSSKHENFSPEDECSPQKPAQRVITPTELEEFLRPSSSILKTDSGQTTQQSPLFFNLPLELRCRILDFACANLRVSFDHVSMRVGAVYPPPRTDEHNYLHRHMYRTRCYEKLPPGPPRWMLLNKQMWSECLQHAHRYAEFYCMYGPKTPLQAHGKPLGLHGLRLDRAHIVSFNDSLVHTLHVTQKLDAKNKRYFEYNLDPESEAFLRQATNFLARSSALKDLSLTLRLSFWMCEDFNPWVEPVRSGITFLEELPKGLHKITMRLHEAHTVWQINRSQYLMLDKIKLELWRISQKLITSPGEEMKEDWLCYDIAHEQPAPVDDCEHPYYHWRMMVTSAAHRRTCVLNAKEGK